VSDVELLRAIDAYLDAVPRSLARTEEIGPFTLFVNEGLGWRYYARPRPGETTFTAGDVARVRGRQRELVQPEEIEWIEDLAGGVGPAAEAAGLRVTRMPLMRLPRDAFTPVPPPAGSVVSPAEPGDLARATAVAMLAFGEPGTRIGQAGPEALAAATAQVDAGTLEVGRDRLARGLTVTAVATVEGVPVAVGSHQPIGGVSEIVGVGSLPAFRRRGLGAAVTSALDEDAFARGVETLFLSAGDETVARVYARVGFRTIGRVGAAAPPP
jgi:GNAT superfamily N-acetyltransferase